MFHFLFLALSSPSPTKGKITKKIENFRNYILSNLFAKTILIKQFQ